jgi:glyoxylase-like metal-dependent hydrolase (beta-lactamase superfamily II)
MKKIAATVVIAVLLVGAAVLIRTASAQSSAEMKVVVAAADALGGRDRLMALRSVRVEGYGQLAAQLGGGNIVGDPDAPQKWINIVDYERTIDLGSGRSRVQQRNVTGFVFARMANYGRVRQNQVIDGTVAYNVGADGKAVRVSDTVARTRRMEMRAHPVAIIRTALAPTTKLANLRSERSSQIIDLETPEGDRLSLAVNATTSLPEWVSWVGRDENLGDVTYRTLFFGYDRVDGVLLPMAFTTKIDWRDVTLQTLMVDRHSIDTPVGDMAAPAAVTASPAPTARPAPKATVLAPGVWFINGGSHNSVVFEFADHLTLFEAGQSNAWARAAIDLARTLSPKPLTEVIVSHHHFDHTGGLRTAIADGLTVITHRGNEGIIREMAERKSTVDADDLGRNPKPVQLKLMDDRLTLKDAMQEVQLVRVVRNNHMVHAIAAYLPRERLFVQADMFVLDWDLQWWGASYMATVKEYGLRIDRDVPIHGGVVPFSEIAPNIDKQFRNAAALCEEGFAAGFPVEGCPAKP